MLTAESFLVSDQYDLYMLSAWCQTFGFTPYSALVTAASASGLLQRQPPAHYTSMALSVVSSVGTLAPRAYAVCDGGRMPTRRLDWL